VTRIEQVGDAAIAVLADQGARGLTHRAVDAAGRLPPGTTSNYARTRAALLSITLRRIAQLDAIEGAVQAGEAAEAVSAAPAGGGARTGRPDVAGGRASSGARVSSGFRGAARAGRARGSAPLTVATLARVLAGVVQRMITDAATRQRLLARFELAFEATRRPELRAAYDQFGGVFRAQIARLLALAGATAPERDAWTLVAWLEGTAFYALAGAGGSAVPPLAELRAQVSQLLAGMCADESGTA
jgi:hypothetical protein